MIRGLALCAGLLAGLHLGLAAQGPAEAGALIEPPVLEPAVAAGKLPPLAGRLPDPPSVAEFFSEEQTLGEHGGRIEILMGRQKDIRLMNVYGYARLVCYDRELKLAPDMLERFEVEDGRIFTFHLREGHRWSDGHPFTAEDFRFYWEDVVNNEELSRFGPPKVLLVEGEAPRVEILDPLTVRYSWSKPNPFFLPAIAGARPLYIYLPAHYLKQFHEKYADPDALKAMIAEARANNWARIFFDKEELYNARNVDMPSLQPWVNTTAPPADRFTFRRNPYYHRIDSAGRQLPYIDEVIVNIADNSLIPAKTGFGETDLQARYIRFDHYTFLKKGEKDRNFRVLLWSTATGSKVAILPNLTAEDPVWRALMRDVRFRRALSVAIDRKAINQVLYYGLGQASADTVLPESPLFKPEYQAAWAQHDKALANRLLDEIGLTRDDEDEVRLLPDGRPLQIIIDSSGESTEESDVLEMIKRDWRQVGIELFTKPSQREVFRNRVFSGQAVMSVWSGLNNAMPTADMAPSDLVPTDQIQLQWSKWGEYFQTSGSLGQAPDMPAALELLELYTSWRYAKTTEERRAVWHEILTLYSDQVFSIGTINGVPQPIVVSGDLRNVPEKAVYSWKPGAFFGIYKPDTFWLSPERRKAE